MSLGLSIVELRGRGQQDDGSFEQLGETRSRAARLAHQVLARRQRKTRILGIEADGSEPRLLGQFQEGEVGLRWISGKNFEDGGSIVV